MPRKIAIIGVGLVGRGWSIVFARAVNPPYLAPVVELVPAPWTSRQTVQSVRSLM